MKKNIPKEVQHYYDDAISKFDFTLSLDDNIKNMIDYVEQVVIKNSKVINDVRDVQKKVEEKQEVVSKLKQEDEAEKHIDSQISRLMKMRY
jgi:thiamine kinase-like enzyme